LRCQRAAREEHQVWRFLFPRNPGELAGTYGSRKGGHRIRGSVTSSGLSTP